MTAPQVIPPQVIPSSDINELIYRQSLINDISTCPKMASYKWLYSFNSASHNRVGSENGAAILDAYDDISIPFNSAVLGSAGHDVVELLHKFQAARNAHLSRLQVERAFSEFYFSRINDLPVTPQIAAGYDTLEDEYEMKSQDYIEMLMNYQEFNSVKTNNFVPVMLEQSFAFQLQYKGEVFTFSGTIDQAGYYSYDGVFSVRDIKFRENAFKPNSVEMSLNKQLIIYSYALAHGNPSCKNCRPVYEESQVGTTASASDSSDTSNLFLYSPSRRVVYNGPCEECMKKKGTIQYPMSFPARGELVWMRDLVKLKKANRGRSKGDFKGKVLYRMFVPPDRIIHYMTDILEQCYLFKHGYSVRHPGGHCLIFCDSASQCRKELYKSDDFDSLFNEDSLNTPDLLTELLA
jgi:hypothetical protein